MYKNVNDIIKIKGYLLNLVDENKYKYSNDEFDIVAFKFIPGKEKLYNVEYLDVFSSFYIDDKFFICYGIDKNNRRFCI